MSTMATLDDYKLSCELYGHTSDVRSLASGEDTDIISGSRDKSVKLWKKTENVYNPVISYQDHMTFVSCVYYLASDRLICTGGNDAIICIYKENTFAPALILRGHDLTVCSISKGIEKMSIISGSWDNTARIWTLNDTGVSEVVLKGHTAAVWAVTSVLGKHFVTGSADKTIVYWSANGELLKVLEGHTDCVRGLIGLEDGTLVSCSNDATIRHWNCEGECVHELFGHSNFIYSIAQHSALGDDVIVSCGEDGTVRMWNLSSGELGAPISHPAQSVWSVACLPNGDIVTGASDGVIRVFTNDPSRYANEIVLTAYQISLHERTKRTAKAPTHTKKHDLPGPEALLTSGAAEGQRKIIRHTDGTVKTYRWENGQWNLGEDVTPTYSGFAPQKVYFEGKLYDYVFSVDPGNNAPYLTLPFNKGNDPWLVAQEFVNRHQLSEIFMEQIVDFIIENTEESGARPPDGYQSPITSQYKDEPETASSSASLADSSIKRPSPCTPKPPEKTHFPVKNFSTFDKCDSNKILQKLIEFNQIGQEDTAVSESVLQTLVKLVDSASEMDKTSVETLGHLLTWPCDTLFPVLDISRLAVRNEQNFNSLVAFKLVDILMSNLNTTTSNQLMAIRCLANMMIHPSGRQHINSHLKSIINAINDIKSGTPKLQITIAIFYLNATVSQKIAVANCNTSVLISEGILEFLKWAEDLEANYISIVAIGNLTTIAFGYLICVQVVSVDHVVTKIRGFANNEQPDGFEKLTEAAKALLDCF